MKTIHQLLPTMQRIIVRVDWNVPIKDKAILDDNRIIESLSTLKTLLNKGCHITLITHLGRPKGGFQQDVSLQMLLPLFQEHLGPVNLLNDINLLGQQWDHPVSLLENVRFWSEEEANDSAFAKTLAKGADAFVNDAFSVSHRAHASVEGVTHHLPSYAGLLMERELTHLLQFSQTYESPLVAICGGAKISTKIDFIENMLTKATTIALVGGLANTFLKAKGFNIGESLVENESLSLAQKIMQDAETAGCQLWLPTHVRVGKSLEDTPVDKPIANIADDDRILDLAHESCQALIQAASNARTIIWNGALGVFEVPQWSNGTFTLANELGHLTQTSEVQTLAGGGETVMALRQTNTFDQFTYVSLAGGAFMEFMEDKELPGVKPLL